MSDITARVHAFANLPDASASGQPIQILAANPKRTRAMFTTDGVVFLAPVAADVFPNGWAINGTAAYGAPPEFSTTGEVWAVRYGSSGTLRVWEECRA